jgi:hypothetical protein
VRNNFFIVRAQKRKAEESTGAEEQQRRIQKQVEQADKKAPKDDEYDPIQCGARKYPAPPYGKQHQSKPGLESQLDPAPLYDAPYYLGTTVKSSQTRKLKTAFQDRKNSKAKWH